MGSAFHQLCPRYSGTLAPTARTAIRLWEPLPFTFTYLDKRYGSVSVIFEGSSNRKIALMVLSM